MEFLKVLKNPGCVNEGIPKTGSGQLGARVMTVALPDEYELCRSM